MTVLKRVSRRQVQAPVTLTCSFCPFPFYSSENRVAMTEFNNPMITKADGQLGQQLYLQWKFTQASPHHSKL